MFHENPATAIYFYDFSHHVEAQLLANEVVQYQSQNKSLLKESDTVSHEFRISITSSLMLLENLLSIKTLTKDAKDSIWLVISQINLLLCTVNDSLDVRLIDQNMFLDKIERFNPLETFQFILDMFKPQANLINCKILF